MPPPWGTYPIFFRRGMQSGEHELKKALRKALFKCKLHAVEELFEKAYSYIR